MDTLDGTSWDVLIAGTGIQQSLLALALSRSGKKILHIDRNDYYGETEAALSLQEAEKWVDQVNQDGSLSLFEYATITQVAPGTENASSPKLGFSRAYSLCLAPNLIYTRSGLLPMLVSSRLHEQIDFQAVGSWFVYNQTPELKPAGQSKEAGDWFAGKLVRVPNSREDIFSDISLNLRAKGALVKFLRFVSVYEEKEEEWKASQDEPFPEFLSSHFKLSPDIHGPLLALTMSDQSPQVTSTGFALRRIANHLRSIGLFGPGFSAVLPKWGGLSEIVQVACRAGAVGGSVYVLDKSIESIDESRGSAGQHAGVQAAKTSSFAVRLQGSDTITANSIVTSDYQLPKDRSLPNLSDEALAQDIKVRVLSRTVSIVSSGLTSLFPAIGEGSPSPAGAIVVFHPTTIHQETASTTANPAPPIHVVVHSSDTGECPTGQCVLYASTAQSLDTALPLLNAAVAQLLASTGEQLMPRVLWSLSYQQKAPSSTAAPNTNDSSPQIFRLNGPTLDLVFDESVLTNVREVWQRIVGEGIEGFMQFTTDQNDFENATEE